MLVDLEGNFIKIQQIENRSMLITGRCGSGKTYAAGRFIEKLTSEMPVVIVDHSASYTEEELKLHSVPPELINSYIDVKKATFCCTMGVEEDEVVDNVADALIAALSIGAKTQWEQLKEACEVVMGKKGFLTLGDIYYQLEHMSELTEDSDEKKNLGHLLKRMYHLKKIYTLKMTKGDAKFENGIHVIQVSMFSERARKDITRLLMEVMWCQIRARKGKYPIQLVLDEFQNLQIKGTAVESMLREGRRFGAGVILLSQFTPSREDRDIVEQASITLHFRPNDRNLTSIAKDISPDEYKDMRNILLHLERGMCVLRGTYSVNDQELLRSKPIVCKVI